ncbi:hypothetical protein [Mesobacillus boroniphilus]|uniref:hypothetical protein n=1 Tax=Mesobacillus boroniphilus TaxID=308892 RepID=UPI001BD041AA|nr:hypothetical protein [Mesobacillus boroniphilus]
MVELTFEDEFKLLSDELGRIFSSKFLDELAKNHKIKQRKGEVGYGVCPHAPMDEK